MWVIVTFVFFNTLIFRSSHKTVLKSNNARICIKKKLFTFKVREAVFIDLQN